MIVAGGDLPFFPLFCNLSLDRCFIPSCDEDRRHFEDYQEFAFALPDITDGCHYYHYEGLDNDNSSFCHPSYFNHDIVDVCREHVYDVHDYAWSFVMHADLADCNDDGIWNLAVSFDAIEMYFGEIKVGDLFSAFGLQGSLHFISLHDGFSHWRSGVWCLEPLARSKADFTHLHPVDFDHHVPGGLC